MHRQSIFYEFTRQVIAHCGGPQLRRVVCLCARVSVCLRVSVCVCVYAGLSPMQLSTISWALPQLCPEVGSEIRYAMKKQFIRQSRDLTPEGFAKTLWGIAR